MAVYSLYVSQYGCADPFPYPSGNTGTRVFCAQHSAVFYNPVGYLLGGLFVDKVFEPIMGTQASGSYLVRAFGSGKGSGAAMLFFFLGIAGVLICLYFRKDRHLWELEEERRGQK